MSVHYYKRCKVNGEVYMQVWRRVQDGKDEFVRSLGSADKLLKKLVRLESKEIQTKELAENLTKISEGKEIEKD